MNIETESIQTNKNYTFNSSNNVYTFYTEKKFGNDLKFSKALVDQIINLYTDFSGSWTALQIAQHFNISEVHVKYILRVLKITHASIPFTEETIQTSDEETLIQSALESKSNRIFNQIQQRELQNLKTDAEKWRQFKSLEINPFEKVLSKWTPPNYVPPKVSESSSKSKNSILVGLSDWHYGLVAHERYLYTCKKDWNISETEAAVSQYAAKIAADIKKNDYKHVKLLLLGDMIHSLTGETDKGTRLEAHPIGEEQLEVAFNSLVNFIKIILPFSNDISVIACSGNHSALGDYILSRMLSLYFRNDSRIKFVITNKRHITFEIGNNIFLMEHGYSAVTKNRLPQQTKARENYINNLFLTNPDVIDTSKRRYYLSADQHHSESYELTGVEGFMFPTLVGGCRYSDNAGYHSRSRQTALVVDDAEGVVNTKYFYFD